MLPIELAPTRTTHLTPCELLEDFADATSGWFYLEDDSRYYAALKGVEACVLRFQPLGARRAIDLAFAAADAAFEAPARLTVLAVEDGPSVEPEAAEHTLLQFSEAFARYAARGCHAFTLRTAESVRAVTGASSERPTLLSAAHL